MYGEIHQNLLVLNVGDGWVAGGCWDDDITSDEMDHSRKFPTFSTSKTTVRLWDSLITHNPKTNSLRFNTASFHVANHQISSIRMKAWTRGNPVL